MSGNNERQQLLASRSDGTLYGIDNKLVDSISHAPSSSSSSSSTYNQKQYKHADMKSEDQLTTQPWKYKAVALACALFLAGIQ